MGLAIKIRLPMPQDLYKNSIKCLQHNFETMQQETGKPGGHGKPGGSFLGIGKFTHTTNVNTNLYLFSNGGKGGRGQDAGDGADIMESYWTHHYLFIANSNT